MSCYDMGDNDTDNDDDNDYRREETRIHTKRIDGIFVDRNRLLCNEIIFSNNNLSLSGMGNNVRIT